MRAYERVTVAFQNRDVKICLKSLKSPQLEP